MSGAVPALFADLCDDAAIFPPGNLPLAQAVSAHLNHKSAAHSQLVGAFVLAANDLNDMEDLVAALGGGSFRVSLTVPLQRVESALTAIDGIPAVVLDAIEVALPDDLPASAAVPALQRALGDREVPTYVELPRDNRRSDVVEALAVTGYRAKLRTGGVSADLYPDEKELAAALASLTAAGIAFKATAGLHHAVRNTDLNTGFEQHGFLNFLAATGAALHGADEAELAAVLAERDAAAVAQRVRSLRPSARNAFRSFGTCSIVEPVEELAAFGLIDSQMMEDLT